MTTLTLWRKTTMDVRYLPDQESYRRMTTAELRRSFLLEQLFLPGSLSMVYADADRAIVGGAIPAERPLRLEATRSEMAAEYFTERRELGVVNIGERGTIRVGEQTYALERKDMLYVGKGAKEVDLMSSNPDRPAVFYLVSFPAHAEYPDQLIRSSEAERNPIGTAEGAGKRTICKYIHPGGAKSCQLVMGLTDLEPGSVWNTMPPHTHVRRMEVYLYFGLGEDDMVVHLMGTPQETRSLIVQNRQGVISPPWSIHCGAATRHYSFIWAMGGENQEFGDMDPVAAREMR